MRWYLIILQLEPGLFVVEELHWREEVCLEGPFEYVCDSKAKEILPIAPTRMTHIEHGCNAILIASDSLTVHMDRMRRICIESCRMPRDLRPPYLYADLRLGNSSDYSTVDEKVPVAKAMPFRSLRCCESAIHQRTASETPEQSYRPTYNLSGSTAVSGMIPSIAASLPPINVGIDPDFGWRTSYRSAFGTSYLRRT